MFSRTWKARAANHSASLSAQTLVLDRQRINYIPAGVFSHALGGLDSTNWNVELVKQGQELSVLRHRHCLLRRRFFSCRYHRRYCRRGKEAQDLTVLTRMVNPQQQSARF